MDASSILNKKDNIENEHQEKLNNEGSNEISIPHDALIFNIKDAKTVSTDYQIDECTIVKKEPMVFIKIPNKSLVWCGLDYILSDGQIRTIISIPCKVIPCVAFSKFIKMYNVVGTSVHTLEKKKGFTTRFTESLEVKGRVSAGIKDCEASLEVTSKYEYEDTITSERTETWQENLSKGVYVVYQNILIYAFIIELGDDFYKKFVIQYPHLIKLEDGPGENKTYLLFAPIYRNDPFTVCQEDIVYQPVEYNDLVEYLLKNKDNWLDEKVIKQ